MIHPRKFAERALEECIAQTVHRRRLHLAGGSEPLHLKWYYTLPTEYPRSRPLLHCRWTQHVENLRNQPIVNRGRFSSPLLSSGSWACFPFGRESAKVPWRWCSMSSPVPSRPSAATHHQAFWSIAHVPQKPPCSLDRRHQRSENLRVPL